MEIAITHKIEKAVDGRQRPSGPGRKWLALCTGLFFIWVFMFIIAPWMQKSPAIKPIADFIEERGIDASALYYTDIDETSEAEMYLYNAARYAPANNQQ